MPLSPKSYTLLCGSFAALGSALYGYDLGVIASVLVAPDFLRTTGLTGTDTTTQNYIGFITSSMLLGAFVGSIPAGLIADKFSRRIGITVAAVLFLVGGTIQTAAINKEMMMAGRFFAGMSIGGMCMLVPLYQSEISLPRFRGRLTTLQQFFLGIGAFIAGWIGYGCTANQYDKPIQWRLPLAFQMVPAIPLLFVVLVLPESPRWLMIRGREEEALQVLAQLHARGDVDDPLVQGEFHEMKMTVAKDAAEATSWKELVQPQNFRKIFLGCTMQFSVQMTGVSFLQYYGPTIYAKVGYEYKTTLLLGCANGILGLISQFTVCTFVDKLGRRKPLIVANTLSGFLFIWVMLISKWFTEDKGTQTMARAFVAVCWLWNFIFSPIGSLSWAYPVEIMNTGMRAKGTAITSMACWIANFMIGQISPNAFVHLSWKYFLLFVVCGFTNAITIWALFPETRGRTLEEMDEYFKETNWFVPTAKVENVYAGEREQQLVQGKYPGMGPAVPDSRKEDVGSEKGGEVSYSEKV